MRVPRCHDLTLAYVEQFNLQTIPFTVTNPDAYFYANGQRYRMREADADANSLGFEVSNAERGIPVGSLWMNAISPFAKRVETEGDNAWDPISADNDQYSTREFLETCGWSEGAIELFGLMLGQEALMNSSFMELLREEVGGYYTDMATIAGGMDLLPRAFLPSLAPHIRFGAARCPRPVARRRHGTFRHRVRPSIYHGRLRHHHRALPDSAPCGNGEAAVPRKAARHPPAPLRCLGEDPAPVPAPLLGRGRRHLRRRHHLGSPDPRDLLP